VRKLASLRVIESRARIGLKLRRHASSSHPRTESTVQIIEVEAIPRGRMGAPGAGGITDAARRG